MDTVFIIDSIVLLIGIILSVNAGRRLALYRYKVSVIMSDKKRLITRFPVLVTTIIAFAWNIIFLYFTKLFTFSLQLVLSGFDLSKPLTSILYSSLIIMVSYKYFYHKYRRQK